MKAHPFRPGMNASADIQTKTHKDVLAVPINAVTTREKNADKQVKHKDSKADDKEDENTQAPSANDADIEEVVFILQPDKIVKKIKVKTDIQDINFIQVIDGLKGGEEIITGPYNVVSKTLKNGDKVKVVPKEQLFETSGNK